MECFRFFSVLPPKIPSDFWGIYLLYKLSDPVIGKDSSFRILYTQTTLPMSEIRGRDSYRSTPYAQGLEKIARQNDPLPKNSKKLWAAVFKYGESAPRGPAGRDPAGEGSRGAGSNEKDSRGRPGAGEPRWESL